MCAAGMDNQHLPSSLLSLSRVYSLAKFQVRYHQQRETTATSQNKAHHMDAILGLAKNWPDYEIICMSKVHLRSKGRQLPMLME